jgi:hypothetical protein
LHDRQRCRRESAGSEGDDRAGIGDVGRQLRVVLQGNAQRLADYLELTLDSRS